MSSPHSRLVSTTLRGALDKLKTEAGNFSDKPLKKEGQLEFKPDDSLQQKLNALFVNLEIKLHGTETVEKDFKAFLTSIKEATFHRIKDLSLDNKEDTRIANDRALKIAIIAEYALETGKKNKKNQK